VAIDELHLLGDYWRRAAQLLDLEIQAPFILESSNGERFEFACLLPQFGSARGLLVGLMADSAGARAGTAAGYAVSRMGATTRAPFELASIVECLVDWGWAVEGKSPPDWYINASGNAV